MSQDLHRRHLDESQRATVAARLKKLLEPAAKERKKRKPKSVPVNLPEQNGQPKDTRDQVGLTRQADASHNAGVEPYRAAGSELAAEFRNLTPGLLSNLFRNQSARPWWPSA